MKKQVILIISLIILLPLALSLNNSINNSNSTTIDSKGDIKLLYFFYIPLTVALVIIIIVLTLVYIGLSKKSFNQEAIYSKAKELVKEFRKRGLSDENIKKKFLEKGWDDIYIKEVMDS
ncbi:MAG: hypothetical protein Q8N99_01665 [Nanoarchaeota archaeon]|nr:hypothetical protein [Nanoarchaeota archaeon]